MVHVCDQNDDNEKFDLNIDKRIIVVHSSSSKTYQGYTKNFHVFIDESRRFQKLQGKKFLRQKSFLKNQRDGLNSEFDEEHPLHESNNLKEDDADDKPDQGPGLLDSDE